MNSSNTLLFLKYYKGVIDTTLREGQQFRFANFTVSDQKKIFKILSNIGVDRIEVGNPISEKVRKNILKLTEISNRPKILSHVRNRLSDVNAAISSKVDGINILCTIDSNRLTKMNIDFHEYLLSLQKIIMLAQKNKLEVRVSVEHFFQSDLHKSIQVYKMAEQLHCDRIGVADTLGVAMSWDVEESIKILRRLFNIDIEVHFHNDLGMANSNALTALKSGANWIDATLLGIGERSGITALSVFLASLYTFDQAIKNRYRLELLTKAENKLAKILGCDVPFNLITNRENGFAHKAGIHLHGIINFGPNTYELFSPQIIGNDRQLIYGTSISGKTSKEDIYNFYRKYKKA